MEDLMRWLFMSMLSECSVFLQVICTVNSTHTVSRLAVRVTSTVKMQCCALFPFD